MSHGLAIQRFVARLLGIVAAAGLVGWTFVSVQIGFGVTSSRSSAYVLGILLSVAVAIGISFFAYRRGLLSNERI